MPRPSVPKIPITCEECSKIVYVAHTRRDTARFCSTPCHDTWRSKQSMLDFWNKVQRCEHGDDCIYCCWPWKLNMMDNGYGQTTVRNRPVGAHRVAWEIGNNQRIPDGLQAAHYCHYRTCCNPMHLHPATAVGNFADSIRDDRIHRGEDHHNSKLTKAKALQAFALKVEGLPNKTIALQLGVSKSTIRNLMAGDIWKDIPRPAVLPKNKPPGRPSHQLTLPV